MSMPSIISGNRVPQLTLVGSSLAGCHHLPIRRGSAKSSNSEHSFASQGLAVLPNIKVETTALINRPDYENAPLSFRGECWASTSKNHPLDSFSESEMLKQTFRLKNFNLSRKVPLDKLHLHSGIANDDVVERTELNEHQSKIVQEHHESWQSQLLKELTSTSLSSKEEDHPERPRSQTNSVNKHPKRAKKKKRKKTKSQGNKLHRSRSLPKSANRNKNVTDISNHSHCLLNHGNTDSNFLLSPLQAHQLSVVPTPPKQAKPKISYPIPTQVDPIHRHSLSTDLSELGKIYGMPQVSSSTSLDIGSKLTKVYWSNQQSGMLKEMGQIFPCAPPATPTPAMLKQYDYVASMKDVRSQRELKVRLEAMGKVQKKKQEQVYEQKQKQEKLMIKERKQDLRKRRRLEIYALNKVMTELEHSNFLDFCNKNGLNCKS